MHKELLNCVVLSNKFARKVELNLSCNEWKVLLFLISRIKPHEKLFLIENIALITIMEVMDVSTNKTMKSAFV